MAAFLLAQAAAPNLPLKHLPEHADFIVREFAEMPRQEV